MIRETVYLGTDNEIVLAALIDGVEWSASSLTRIVISMIDDDGNETILDSSDGGIDPDTFDWTTQTDVLDSTINVITLKLGKENITVRDDYVATLKLYAPTFPSGIIWDDKLSLKVV